MIRVAGSIEENSKLYEIMVMVEEGADALDVFPIQRDDLFLHGPTLLTEESGREKFYSD